MQITITPAADAVQPLPCSLPDEGTEPLFEEIIRLRADNEALRGLAARFLLERVRHECDATDAKNAATALQDAAKWLIWSNEHNAWWKPNRMGYCRNRKEAGRFGFKEACEIVENANYKLEAELQEAMVRDV